MGSTGDTICPPREHSDRYSDALGEHEVECSYTRKPLGEHGFALGDEPNWWTCKAVKWLRAHGFGEAFDEDDAAAHGDSIHGSRATSPSPLTLPEEAVDKLAIIPVHGHD